MTEKNEQTKLKVVEALQEDAYKGIARIDSEVMRQMGIKRGDVISIKGRRETVAIADRNARARCFEYLVGAIDEAWARYCDATAYVEDEVHGYITPASLASGDDDEEEEDDNKELMNVKCRLLKSKDFLQDHIESFDMNDVKKFWHRWDITKYQMLDVMEDEDDVLEELESGRRIF